VDPRNTIIQCDPHSNNLLYHDFKEIFSQYGDRVVFDYEGESPYPMIVEEDVLDRFKEINPKIDYLIEKFNLKI
jgi:hypothetical protein